MSRERKLVKLNTVIERYVPAAGYVLIVKDQINDKWGQIYLSKNTANRMQHYGMIGRIAKKSPHTPTDQDDQVIQDRYKEGDLVGFATTTPLDAPIPPWYQLDEDERNAILTLHVADIVNVFEDKPEEECPSSSQMELKL